MTSPDESLPKCSSNFFVKLCNAFSSALANTSGSSGARTYQTTVIRVDGISPTGQLVGRNLNRVGIIVFTPIEDILGLDIRTGVPFLESMTAIVEPQRTIILKQDEWGPLLQYEWFWTQDLPIVTTITVTELIQ